MNKIWLKSQHDVVPKWAILRSDRHVCSQSVFHFEVYWIACDSWLMEEFINTLFMRCKTINLRLLQVPELFSIPNLLIHPYRSQPCILFSNRYEISPEVAYYKHKYIHKYILDNKNILFSSSETDRSNIVKTLNTLNIIIPIKATLSLLLLVLITI